MYIEVLWGNIFNHTDFSDKQELWFCSLGNVEKIIRKQETLFLALSNFHEQIFLTTQITSLFWINEILEFFFGKNLQKIFDNDAL